MGTLPFVIQHHALAELGVLDTLAERLHGIRLRLLSARAARELPIDDKELAGWNGLLLAALLLAGAAAWLGRDLPRWAVERLLAGAAGARVELGELARLKPREVILRRLRVRAIAARQIRSTIVAVNSADSCWPTVSVGLWI